MPINKQCAASGQPFTVRDEDITFYDKVSPVIAGQKYLIPPPSLCPDERARRRLAWRNEKSLHKRKSSLSGEETVSIYHPDSPLTIFTHREWWSDDWDPLDYGKSYNPNRPFFDQFHDLQLRVPRPPLVNNKSENADFCNFSDWNKNSYLITSANCNEDSYYGFCLVDNKNAVDCLWCVNSESMYECTDCNSCYNLRFSVNCSQCTDSSFLLNCRNLSHCICCVNLRNREYCIFNKQYSKEEYLKKERELLKGSHLNYVALQQQFREFLRLTPVRKANNFVSSENVVGENIYNSKNIFQGFDVYGSQDCAYLHDGYSTKDSQDVEFFGETELSYESTSLMGRGFRFTMFCRNSTDLIYCDNCHGCSDCFGCVGLRNKKYCILNKEYTKEQYEEIVPRIIEGMSKTGDWGEFFPIKHSLFPYNETLAQDYYPLTQEEALKRGYTWHEHEEKSIMDAPTHPVPDHVDDLNEFIAGRIFKCECGRNFQIIKQELEFYRKMGLPAPHKCPNCRHMERLGLRNPRRLYDRACANCQVPVKTAFAPDRPEALYCESCFLKHIY